MSTVIKTLCAGMIAAFASLSNVQAADAAVSPGYVGADIGAVTYDGNTSALTRVYGGLTIGSGVAFGLPQVHALELMLYTTRLNTDGYNPSPYDFIPGIRTRANGAAVSWTTALKLNDSWSLTSRLGATYTHTKNSYDTGGAYAAYSWSRDTAGVIAGVGAAYKLSPNVSATLDINYMPIKLDSYRKSDPTTVSAGLKYHF
ncbi:MAG TPA: outer membrane beta-barrel protein [Duganella sp.]|nr:outer membrane beta-barrel protein [Duganella sp.]